MLKVANSAINASQIATPITLPGDVTLSTGNLVIGTAGKGIDFSATSHPAGMTSELLSDYEEGTWTPSQGAGLTVVGTFSSSGTYTKVGRLVTLRASVTGSTSISLAANDTAICGSIPFTPAGSVNNRTVGGTINNTNTIFGASSALGGFTDIYNIGIIAATTNIHFSVSYFT